jgi:hypothetical protein
VSVLVGLLALPVQVHGPPSCRQCGHTSTFPANLRPGDKNIYLVSYTIHKSGDKKSPQDFTDIIAGLTWVTPAVEFLSICNKNEELELE